VELHSRAEEILESLWKAVEENRTAVSLASLGLGLQDEALQALLERGFVIVERGITAGGEAAFEPEVRLAPGGEQEARNTVRRHRLAERLMHDVLDLTGAQMDEPACRFEHLLARGIEERICSLLGHPKSCPHGRPIPPGSCCLKAESGEPRLVSALSGLRPGQGGHIAYLHLAGAQKMQKLAAMGVLPGCPIRLVQRYPSFIFQAGFSQFAVDEELASGIYVRLEEPEQAPASSEAPRSGRRSGRHRRRGRLSHSRRPIPSRRSEDTLL
jgi:DtxR family Mn-dependent transcriptional regulator